MYMSRMGRLLVRFFWGLSIVASIVFFAGCASEEMDLSDPSSADGDFADESSSFGNSANTAKSKDGSVSSEVADSENTADELLFDEEPKKEEKVASNDQKSAKEPEEPAERPHEDKTQVHRDSEPVAQQQPVEETLTEPVEPNSAPQQKALAENANPPDNQITALDGPVTAIDGGPETPVTSGAPVEITSLNFKPNESGGAILIEARSPFQYTTSYNPSARVFAIEIADSKMPRRLQQPLVLKDFSSPFTMVTGRAQVSAGTSRIEIQLRPGASEPVVSGEGNRVMVVAERAPAQQLPLASVGVEAEPQAMPLSSRTLDEFLQGNTQYFGKKISIEASDMDIREAFKFITEESGINLVLSEEVKGKISLRLRQIPWDQALIVIMKDRRLGYIRTGSIIRVAPLRDLKAEEQEALSSISDAKTNSPLKVRMFPISYAKPDDLLKQIQPFLTEKRGQAFADNRTSALVISDTEETLKKVAQLVETIDVAPPQVLIEGKVVEARDGFKSSIGVRWSASGSPNQIGSNSKGGSINFTPSLGVTPGDLGTSFLKLGFSIGTLDAFGSLDAALALHEQDDTAKVISSPRVVTLHNEQAVINQITEIPLIQTTSNPTSGFTQNSVSYKATKLSLTVTPQVTNDGNVIMSVDVNRDFLGSITDKASGARPVNTRSAKTKVLVKNGQTAVIGGIYQSDSTETEFKVPGLGDIPILGYLFKGSEKTKDKNELLIFLTPRILGQADSQGYGGGDVQ